MITRDTIIQEARTWLNTPFHHQGRVKKSAHDRGGCDCLGFIIGVAQQLNISSGITINNKIIPLYKYDRKNYSKVITGNILYDHLCKLMHIKDKITVGDVILFNMQNRLQHLGFYSYEHSIIHSVRKVVEHRLDNYWQSKIAAIFSFKEII